MAKLTKKQYIDFNNKCKNGFKMDLEYFLTWGEKRCIKQIKIAGDENIYRLELGYHDEYKNFAKLGSVVTCELKKLVPLTSGCYRVLTLEEKTVSEMVQRRNMKMVQDMTANYTDEKMLEMIKAVA